MKRRIIKQGTSTLTVSLPSKWIKERGVKPGDEVEVESVGSELRISHSSAGLERRAEIDITGMNDNLIFRHLNILYMDGFDEVYVYFGNQKELAVVQQGINLLIGFAIVEQKQNNCIIKEIVDTKGEDFNRILKRVFLTIEGTTTDALEFIKAKDWKSLASLKKNDREVVNKLAFFCIRILSKKGYVQPEKTQVMRDLVLTLENLGDDYANLSEEIAQLGKPLSYKTLEKISQVNMMVKDIEKLFYSYNRADLLKLNEIAREIRFDVSKANKAMPREDFVTLFHVRKIAEWLLNIIEFIILLNVNFDQANK